MVNPKKRYIVIDVDNGYTGQIMYATEHLSRNFQVWEFACSDGSDVILYSSKIVQWVQRIRDRAGCSIELISAFRTPKYNWSDNVGGAKDSFHMYGRAVDMRKPRNISLEQFYNLVQSVAGEVSGIIMYSKKGFVHMDNRDYNYRERK